jgi:hypothetical protein
MPITLEINQARTGANGSGVQVQFTNVETNAPLNVLIYDINYDRNGDSEIDVGVVWQTNGSAPIKNPSTTPIKYFNKSEGSYNI